MDDWNIQNEKNIFHEHIGLTVLIKFVSDNNGITMDDGYTVDISWLRSATQVYATTGNYVASDILSWKVIK